MSIKIKQLPETERPYEKLELYGEKRLSNAELLAIIIKTGTKEESSLTLAQRILSMNNKNVEQNNLDFLREFSLQELMKIKGIGRVKAIQIKALCELASRMAIPINYKKIRIKSPEDVAKLLMEEVRFEKVEIAKLLILNTKNEILKIKNITIGGTNFTNISIKDILVEPIKMQAPKIILVHNHPSGDPTPSKADIQITERLHMAAMSLDIQLLDHIVIGNMKYVSIFSEMVSDENTI